MARVESYFPYDPSVPAAIVFAALYTVTFIGTFYTWIRYRAWVWCVMVLAAGMAAVGYIARVISTKNVDSRGLYIIQFCLIILAPVLMAAALYIAFGRLVFHVIPPSSRTAKFLWVPPRFVTPIFVVCDIIAFLVQLVGAVIVSGTQLDAPDARSKLNRGKNIVITGLGVQMVCFGLFTIIAVRFYFTSQRFGKEFTSRVGGNEDDTFYTIDDRNRRLRRDWRPVLWTINVGCLLILVRSVYRIVDFAMGKAGYMQRHEWFFYVFDALPILPCIALFVWYHPGRYLPYLSFRLPAHLRKGGDYQHAILMTPTHEY